MERPIDIFDIVANTLAGRELSEAEANAFLDKTIAELSPEAMNEVIDFCMVYDEDVGGEELDKFKRSMSKHLSPASRVQDVENIALEPKF